MEKILSNAEIILINELRDNSRKSLKQISEKTGIPASTLYDSLERINKNKILKHTSLLDFYKMGYTLRTNFIILPHDKKQMLNFLMQSQCINTLSNLSGDHDFFIECIFQNLDDYTNFKQDIEKIGLKSFNEHFILEDIKKENFLLNK
jgi:Lrp/AsnC family transcriptional regulator, regulator for asnA, asnC and gidA